MRRVLIVSAGVWLALLPLGAPLARTGPEPVSSSPEDGETVHRAPDRVEMTFSEPLDPSSNITVLDECDRVVSGDTDVSANEMSTPLTLKPSGHYRVQWEATGLAGASGTNRGDFSFHAHMGDPCDPDDNNNGDHHNGNGHNGHNGNNHGNHHGDHNGGNHGSGHAGTGHAPSTHTTDHSDHFGVDHADGHPSDDHAGAHKGKDHDGGRHRGGHGDGKHHAKDKQTTPDGGGDHPRLTTEGPTRTDESGALNLLLALALPALLGVGGGSLLRSRLA